MNQIEKTLNSLAEDVYLNACMHGFHDGDSAKTDIELLAKWTANLHGEVSELWEAARKGQIEKDCDKEATIVCPNVGIRRLTCAEEELADIIIRALDTSSALDIDIGAAVIAKHEFNKTRPHLHGGKLA